MHLFVRSCRIFARCCGDWSSGDDNGCVDCPEDSTNDGGCYMEKSSCKARINLLCQDEVTRRSEIKVVLTRDTVEELLVRG